MRFVKNLYSIPVVLFALSGCGTKSYEKQAGLSPMPTPVVVAGSVKSSSVASSAGPTVPEYIRNVDTSITSAISPAAAAALVTQAQTAIQMSAIVPAIDPHHTERQKYINQMFSYYERAALLKQKQLEDGDQKDSTGEVAKYIEFAHQSSANCDTLPPAPKRSF